MASDLSCDLMLVLSHLCLSTIGHRIFGFFSPWPFLPYSLFQAILRCRACHSFGLPLSGKSSLKQFLQSHQLYLPEGAELGARRWADSDLRSLRPARSTRSTRSTDPQDPQIHEIHKIHKIHKIHNIHEIHRSTEPGSLVTTASRCPPPDLTRSQLCSCAEYSQCSICYYRQFLILHAHTV